MMSHFDEHAGPIDAKPTAKGLPAGTWLRRAIGSLFLLGVCLLWSGVGFVISDDRHRVIAAAVKENDNLGRAFAEHIVSTVGALDQLALLVKTEYEVQGASVNLAALQQKLQIPATVVVQIAVIDSQGYVAVSNLPFSRTDLSDREHYRVHVAGDSGKPYISKPVLGRVSGKWSVQLTRRINNRDGSFGGVAVISFDPYYLARFYEQVDLGSDGFAALVGLDRVVRARRVGRTFSIGHDLSPTGSLFTQLERSASGHFLSRGTPDGIRRYLSYRRLEDYPFVVVVGRAEAEILKDFSERRAFLVGAALFVTLTLSAAALWLMTLARRMSIYLAQIEDIRARQQAFMDSLPDSAWMKDAAGRFIAVNRAFLARFHVGAESVIGKTAAGIVGAEYVERLEREDAEVMQSGRALRIEHTAQVDGETRWLETIKVPVLDRSGRLRGTTGISRDVTERNRTKEALAESERRLKLALDGAGVALFDWNIASGEVYISEQWAAILGGDPSVTYTDIRALARTVHPDDSAPLRDQVLNSLRPEVGLYRAVHRVRRNDGTWAWIQSQGAVVARDADGRALRMLGINTDITARKAAELALRDANAFLDSIVDNIPDMIFVKDATNLKFLRVNNAAAVMVGRSREEIIGRRDHDLFPAEQADRFAREDAEALAKDGVIEEPEQCLQTPTLGRRFFRAKKLALRDEAGRPRYLLSLAEDVTERRQAEVAMREMNAVLKERAAQLAALNEELDAFNSSVSHDLRAPLRHISGFIKLLREHLAGRADPRAVHMFDRISSAAARMNRLIEDLLSFSRAGHSELRKESLQLDELVAEAIAELQAETAGRSIEWRVDGLPQVHADRGLLRLAFANLIGNAVKYTGKLDVAVIEIGARSGEDGRIVVFVRDNGVGFDMKDAPRLFGVFQRLHSAAEFEGTGLGLANVKRIVERHGGRVWAESTPGEGAAFFVALPAATLEGAPT